MPQRTVQGFVPNATERRPVEEGIRWAGLQADIEAEVAAALDSLNRAHHVAAHPYALVAGLGEKDETLDSWEVTPLIVRAHELHVPTCVIFDRALGRSAVSDLVTINRRDMAVAFDSQRPQSLVPDVYEWLLHIVG